MKWVIRTKSPVPFLGDRQKMWGVPKIQEGTPLSLDVLFHGKSHKEQHAEPFQAAQWNPFLHLLCRGVGVGLASLVTLPAIGAKTGGIKA